MEAPVRVVKALERLKTPFLEEPGTKLSLSDAANIAGIEPDVCHVLLSALVEVRFLTREPDGAFRRPSQLSD